MSTMGPSPAKSKVTPPAIALIVTAALGILSALYNLIMALVRGGTATVPGGAGGEQAAQIAAATGGVTGIIFAIIGIAVGGVIIFGALKMMQLESYGLAMTASILALIPCISPCCCITLPFGIWSLIVLMKPEVKAAFRT